MAVYVEVDSRAVELMLAKLPRRINAALREKMQVVLDQVKEKMLSRPPGKFVAPETVETEVEWTQVGSRTSTTVVVGFISATDKRGVYSILPSKARVLRFVAKSGELVFAPAVHAHPYPKGSVAVEEALAESSAQIVRELEDAVVEAL